MNYDSPAEVCGEVLDLVLEAFQECDRPEITTSYVGLGTIPADDCCGTLVVSPVRVYRASQFPGEDNGIVNCDTSYLAVTLLVTVIRCIPGPTSSGRPPSAQALDLAFRSVLEDGAVVWNALTGGLPEDWEWANLSQDFVGPEGLCIAVNTTITVSPQTVAWCICPPQPS